MTALLAFLIFPGYQLATLAREITFSALEIVNFHFADKSVDYFQSQEPASPVLHFWSLAVEEQFYMVWPVLLLGVGAVFRPTFLRAAAVLLGIVWCTSFGASLILTFHDQPFAYFTTGTRCWQLATGALLAVGWQTTGRLPRSLRAALAWCGLMWILAAIALLDESRTYPGMWALLPTLGAAGLIAGFDAARPDGALRGSLNLPVMQWVGARSYSWYLWHWPLLALPRIAYPEFAYIELIAVPASLAMACAAYAWIETPFRRSRLWSATPVPTLAGAAAGLAIVVGAGYLYRPALPLIDPAMASRVAQLESAARDKNQAQKDKCELSRSKTQQGECLYGDRAGSRRVVLFGDSHAGHWFPAVDIAAREAGWQLNSWTKSGCPTAELPVRSSGGTPYTTCQIWREDVMRRVTGAERPDAVFMSNHSGMYLERSFDPSTGELLSPSAAADAWIAGFRKTIRRLREAGVKVVVIRDIPKATEHYQACLLRNGSCAAPRDWALAGSVLDAEAVRGFGEGVTLVDLSDLFCESSECPIIRNGTLVYRDSNHLAAAFSATLAPRIGQVLHKLTAMAEPQGKPALAAPASPGHLSVQASQ